MKIVYITIYPARGLHHEEDSGVASYAKNLITNIPTQEGDEIFILCNKSGKQESYSENNINIIRCYDKNPKYIWQLSQQVKKINPDVIHIQHEFLHIFGGKASSLMLPLLFFSLRKFNLITTFHHVLAPDSITSEFTKQNNAHVPGKILALGFSYIYKMLSRFSRKVIVHNEAFKNILSTGYKINPEKIEIVAHGVEDKQKLNKHESRKKYGYTDNQQIILFMGFLTHYKGLDLLIEGFAKYVETNPNALLLIGAGMHPRLKFHQDYMTNEYNRLETKAQDFIPAQNYRWLGFIPENEIQQYYSLCDTTIFPYMSSLSASGPFSISIAYGTPFLVSDVFSSVVDHQELIFKRNPDSLANCLTNFFAKQHSLENYLKELKSSMLWSKLGKQYYAIYQASHEPVKSKIMLLGTHGQDNWGDELLLDTFLLILGKNNEYFVNSYNPEQTQARFSEQYNIKAFNTTKEPLKVISYLIKSDLLFFGGGSILKELYKNVGRNKYSSMLMILGIVLLAKIFRKKIIMSNIGIGPIKSRVGKFLAKTIINLTDFVCTRDQESYQLALECKANQNKLKDFNDIVFYRTPESLLTLKQALKSDSKECVIALNLNYNVADNIDFERFTDNLAKLLIEFAKQKKVKIITLPMQIGFNPNNDVRTLDKFLAKIKNLNVEISNPQTFAELYKVIQTADIVMAERLHALILASILGKPIIPLIYDVKVASLTKALDIAEYSINMSANFSVTKNLQILEAITEKPTDILSKINLSVKKLRSENQNYVSQLLQNLSIPKQNIFSKIGTKLQNMVKSPYFIAFMVIVVFNCVVFRNQIFDYVNSLHGNSVVVSEELIPIFDFQTQYIDGLINPFSQLTNNFEFRVRYSLLTTWVRYFPVLPIALILLNATTFLLIYSANVQIIQAFRKVVDKNLYWASFAGAFIIYCILLYSKITHFYTLIFGFGLFAFVTAKIFVKYFSGELNSFNWKTIALLLFLTLINPAVHYVILEIFLIGLLGLFELLVQIYRLIRKHKFNFKALFNIAILGVLIALLYYIFVYYFITGMGKYGVEDQASLTHQIIYYFSVSLEHLLTIQIGASIDASRNYSYFVDFDNRFLNLFYIVLTVLSLLYIFIKHNLYHSGKKLTVFFIGLIIVAIFFSIGYEYPISAHNTMSFLLDRFGDNNSPLIKLFLNGLSTFFSILRFPHRFMFIFLLIISFLNSLIIYEVFDKVQQLLKPNKYHNLIKSGLIFILCFPVLANADYIYTFFLSGNFGDFLENYKITDDLKSIKTYLGDNKKGKLLIVPSAEIPYRRLQIADDDGVVKFIDKFYIYYLDYPSIYYGNGASKEIKSYYSLLYLEALNDNNADYLIQNTGVSYILYNKQQYIYSTRNYYNNLESKLFNVVNNLVTEGKAHKALENSSYILYEINNNYVSEKSKLVLDIPYDSIQQQKPVYNNYTVDDISLNFCDENEFYITGDETKITRDLIASCYKKFAQVDSKFIAFATQYQTIDDYFSLVTSVISVYTSPLINKYNDFNSINPGVYDSITKSYIGITQKNVEVSIPFDVNSDNLYSMDLRIKAFHIPVLITITDQNGKQIFSKEVDLTTSHNYLKNNEYTYLNFDYSWIDNLQLQKGHYNFKIRNLSDKPLIIDGIIVYNQSIFDRILKYVEDNQQKDNIFHINSTDVKQIAN